MTELATLARPYATAVFKRAKESSATKDWSGELALLKAVVTNDEMAKIVNNPKIKKEKLVELILSVCDIKISSEGANFLRLLVQNNRLSLLPFIVEIYEQEKADAEGYLKVDVLSAYPFSKDANQKFTKTLEKAFKKEIHMNVTVDKSLIGGVLVRAGDKVIDGSIRGQLQHLQKALQ